MATIDFEWDAAKNAANLAKHRIDFDDAVRIFDAAVVTRRSDRGGEARWIAVGLLNGIEIAVIYTQRGEARRIISARRARDYEREWYRQKGGR